MIELMGILVTILALGIVIFFHELGHFLMAKRAGIGVYEFSIGMGPKIFGWKRDETDYTLRLLPIGGFVKLAGMDDESDEHPVSDDINYHKKSFSERVLTLVAGCVMNFILGLLIFFIMAKFIGQPSIGESVHTVMPDSPAAIAGLAPGDTIISINGEPLEDTQSQFIPVIKDSLNKPVVIKLERDGVQNSVLAIPRPAKDMPEQGQLGLVFSVKYTPQPWGDSFYSAGQSFWIQVVNTFQGLKMLISGSVGIKDMAGPIGIVQFASFNLGQSWYQFIHFMAIISVVLGVFNLFPIPLLDGGHLLFLAIEFLRGKPLPEKLEHRIHTVSGAILLSLMAVIVFNDILNWSDREVILESLKK